METFHFNDTIVNTEDNSNWKFQRYQIDKVTVSAEWARENNWQGSPGSKTWLFAVPLNESEGTEERKFLSKLFVKAQQQ